MLMLESVDRNAANDVVREERNLNEIDESIQKREKLSSSALDTTHKGNRSNTDVQGYDDETWSEPMRGGRKRYEYFQWVTIIRLG